MNREHPLTAALCALLASRRTAALGTVDASGAAFVSLVPFAIDAASASLVIHISALAAQCRAAYLARFPEAEPMTQLGDFRFLRLTPQGARLVAGFGAARSLSADELAQALSPTAV